VTAPTGVSAVESTIERGYFVESGAPDQPLTLDEFRELTDTFPAGAKIFCDGLPVRVAGRFGDRVLLDTGLDLPSRCPACRVYGCDGRCREP
jgi:hypothetical protein